MWFFIFVTYWVSSAIAGQAPLIRSLPYSSFSSSSEYPRGNDWNYHTARSIDMRGWLANIAANQHLQVDFGSKYEITSVSTWPRRDSPSQYVKTYKLSYSIDGITFTDYGKMLNGNNAADVFQEVNNVLDPGFTARYLRFMPDKYTTTLPAMRVEAYTDAICCNPSNGECIYNKADVADVKGQTPLVVSLPYSAFSSSSEWDRPYHTARRIDQYAWIVASGAVGKQHLQVDFGSTYEIKSVSTWPRGDTPTQYVKTYTLSYSIDGITFTDYGKILNGNYAVDPPDASQEVNNVLDPSFTARYLRFMPETYAPGYASMRVEAYTDAICCNPTNGECIYNEADVADGICTYPKCNSNVALDIVFLLDESGSISVNEWQVMIDFVKRVIKWDINEISFISLIEYGSLDDFSHFLKFTESRQIETIFAALENNEYRESGVTETGDAIERTLRILDEWNADNDQYNERPDLVFLLTDGIPTDDVCPDLLDTISNSNVEIILIGIQDTGSNQLDPLTWTQKLYCLCNVEKNAFFVAEFTDAEFSRIEGNLREKTCTTRTYSQLVMPPYSSPFQHGAVSNENHLNHLLYVATGIILCLLLIIFLCWSQRNKGTGVNVYAKTKQNEVIDEL